MKLVKTVTAMDYGAIVRDPAYVLDQDRVRRYQKHLQAGRAMPPVFVSAAGCKCLDGEHRLEAAKLEGVTTGPACVYEPESIGDARIFQLQTNGERRGLTPEETAELVELLAAEEAANDAVNGNSETDFPNSDATPKKRGRKKTAEGKAIDRVAKESGVTPAAVRQRVKKAKEPAENTEPVSAELLKPPPTLESRLKKVIAAAKFAHEALTTEATSPDWRQWKLDSLLSSAHHDALALVEKVEKVLWLLTDKKRSIHRADFEGVERARRERDKAAEKEAKRQERAAKKVAERHAAAENAALGPYEHVCNGSPCTAMGTGQCLKGERIANGGGLRAPEKRITVYDDDGKVIATGTLPEEEPPPLPPEEAIVASWEEGDATFGPDGETEDEGAF